MGGPTKSHLCSLSDFSWDLFQEKTLVPPKVMAPSKSRVSIILRLFNGTFFALTRALYCLDSRQCLHRSRNIKKKTLKPLENMCSYAINSSKKFKEYFLKTRENFDTSIHEIISTDAQKLYTVNVKLVIDEIIKVVVKMQKHSSKLTPLKNRTQDFQPKYPQKQFSEVSYIIYQSNLTVSTIAGFFQQIDGLSMSSKISFLNSKILS